MFLLKATLASLLTHVNVTLAGPSLATGSVPAAIDHFHVRFTPASVL
jgi:hypothetical protein